MLCPADHFRHDIACADHWMPQWWVKLMAKQIVSGTARHFKDYKPDTAPKKAEPLPGKLLNHTENTSISRYVWLPIEWEGDKPVIHWTNEWLHHGFARSL